MGLKHVLAVVALTASFTPSAQAPADYDAGLAAYGAGDYHAAATQWKELAERGEAQAQFNLAFMYDNGQGVPHDYTTAAFWYLAAAEQGHPDAAWNLGMMYASGQGVARDYVEAYKWLSVSALFGDEDVQGDRQAVAKLLTNSQLSETELWLLEWTPRQSSAGLIGTPTELDRPGTKPAKLPALAQ